jgi:hypothetical protein
MNWREMKPRFSWDVQAGRWLFGIYLPFVYFRKIHFQRLPWILRLFIGPFCLEWR